MTALPLRSASVDGAYATESLEHAVDIPLAVAELTRIVKPGGRIVIIDKSARAWGRLETPPWEKWFDEKGVERFAETSLQEGIQPADFLLGRYRPGWTVFGVVGREVARSKMITLPLLRIVPLYC